MATDKLTEDFLSCLVKDFERRTPAGLDLFFFCYQNEIAPTGALPIVSRLKSEGLVIVPHFGVYALTASGYAHVKRCAGETRLRRVVSRVITAMRIGLIRLRRGLKND